MSARKPTTLKALHGTDRPDREAPEPPRSPEGAEIPEPPEWLDEHGRAKWAQLIPELASRRLLTGTALSLLEVLCEAWSDYRLAREVIRAEGSSYKSKKGEEGKGDTMFRRRPEVEIARDAGKQYAQLLARFEKLIETVQPSEQKDPMDGFLERGQRGRSRAAG